MYELQGSSFSACQQESKDGVAGCEPSQDEALHASPQLRRTTQATLQDKGLTMTEQQS